MGAIDAALAGSGAFARTFGTTDILSEAAVVALRIREALLAPDE